MKKSRPNLPKFESVASSLLIKDFISIHNKLIVVIIMKKEEKMWGEISKLNSVVEIARGTGTYPFRAIQNDCTLRDGLQTPGVHLTREERIQIGLKLDECRVYNIECAASTDEDKEVIKALAHDCTYSKVLGITNVYAGKSGLDKIVDSGAHGGIIMAPPGGLRLAAAKMSGEDLIKSAVELIEYAKDRGFWVMISATDATRADLDLLKRLAICC